MDYNQKQCNMVRIFLCLIVTCMSIAKAAAEDNTDHLQKRFSVEKVFECDSISIQKLWLELDTIKTTTTKESLYIKKIQIALFCAQKEYEKAIRLNNTMALLYKDSIDTYFVPNTNEILHNNLIYLISKRDGKPDISYIKKCQAFCAPSPQALKSLIQSKDYELVISSSVYTQCLLFFAYGKIINQQWDNFDQLYSADCNRKTIETLHADVIDMTDEMIIKQLLLKY